MTRAVDITGQVFGRWTVTSRAEDSSRGKARWLCECECSELRTVRGDELRSGRSRSCGCVRTIHGCTKGGSRTPESRAWTAMRCRCRDRNDKDYGRYGGRGISVCDSWNSSFESFLKDMGERPSPKHSLDRIDNDGNYEPGNCRWTTQQVQIENRSITVWLTANGRRRTITQWCRHLGGGDSLVRDRLKAGWTEEEALSAPARKRRAGPRVSKTDKD